MARFYLTAVNSRGNSVSAAGSASGQDAHLRGWNAGVEVEAFIDADGRDAFRVYMTSGSNYRVGRRLLGIVNDTEVGPRWQEFGPYEVTDGAVPTYTGPSYADGN